MPGPAPKSAATRARTNKKSTHLQLQENPDAAVPPLPTLHQERDEHGDWHPVEWDERAESAWEDLWRSPMAEAWIPTDVAGVERYIVLLNSFYITNDIETKVKLSTELRQLGQDYGLTPRSRASLQWEVIRTEKAAMTRPTRPTEPRRPTSPEEELAALTA